MVRFTRLALAAAGLTLALTSSVASAAAYVPDAAGYQAVRSVERAASYSPPLDGRLRITTPFGEPGPYWKAGHHPGIDFGVRTGTPVKAIRAGVVIEAESQGWNKGYALYVKVDHGDGLHSLCAHLSELKVEVGDVVGAGDVIALSGNGRVSTGPHLHLEVRERGVKRDPAPYIGLA